MDPFDLPGALRRIRRQADLSQRELAEGCHLAQSAVAQAETGRRDLPVTALARAAALAGLRLALLDGNGVELPPMSSGSVRDLGGRHFPAHLDTRRTAAGSAFHEQRRDRPETAFTFVRDRPARDARRDARGTPTDHHPQLPGDTPPDAARRAGRRWRCDGRRSSSAAAPPVSCGSATTPGPAPAPRRATSWTTGAAALSTPTTARAAAISADPLLPWAPCAAASCLPAAARPSPRSAPSPRGSGVPGVR